MSAGPTAVSAPVIRVVVVDDHDPVRRGIGELIATADDMVVVGEAATVADALTRIRETRPCVAVLDERLPDGSGIDLCREIIQTMPETRCVILTGIDDEDVVGSAATAGASAFLLKEIRGINLLDTIREVAAGRSMLPPS
jgi:two-component system response regulator DevR